MEVATRASEQRSVSSAVGETTVGGPMQSASKDRTGTRGRYTSHAVSSAGSSVANTEDTYFKVKQRTWKKKMFSSPLHRILSENNAKPLRIPVQIDLSGKHCQQ